MDDSSREFCGWFGLCLILGIIGGYIGDYIHTQTVGGEFESSPVLIGFAIGMGIGFVIFLYYKGFFEKKRQSTVVYRRTTIRYR